jgi:hypothetical protein
MQEILHHQPDGWNPIKNGINHLSTGAGLLPSTVWLRESPSNYTSYDFGYRLGTIRVGFWLAGKPTICRCINMVFWKIPLQISYRNTSIYNVVLVFSRISMEFLMGKSLWYVHTIEIHKWGIFQWRLITGLSFFSVKCFVSTRWSWPRGLLLSLRSGQHRKGEASRTDAYDVGKKTVARRRLWRRNNLVNVWVRGIIITIVHHSTSFVEQLRTYIWGSLPCSCVWKGICAPPLPFNVERDN